MNEKALNIFIQNYPSLQDKIKAISEHQVWGECLFNLFLWSGAPSYTEAKRSRKHFVVSGNGLIELFERNKDRYRDFDLKLFVP